MRLQVKVKPNARTSRIEQLADGSWHAQLRAQPVDGAANKELIALVAAHFGVPRASVSIRAGGAGRNKWVDIAGPA
jgi:uncharacterized protein YggU (UPF0235/DUF167 family)